MMNSRHIADPSIVTFGSKVLKRDASVLPFGQAQAEVGFRISDCFQRRLDKTPFAHSLLIDDESLLFYRFGRLTEWKVIVYQLTVNVERHACSCIAQYCLMLAPRPRKT